MRWPASGKGFGIVAGTGTGKTLAIRPIAEAILQEPLDVGVVNREREATPDTPNWNVVIVTTGIARRWFQDDLITGRDTVIVDEIHQTSAELELCLALGKRAGCRFIWLSATVDPAFYARYLESADVLATQAFDPELKAKVQVLPQKPDEFLNERYIRHIIKEKRGVAVFLPTRAEVERLGAELGEQWKRLTTAFYHGGEPIRVIRPFLEGEVERPFLLAMTAAGQSALNVRGLDTVVIYDARYGNVVERGRNVLHRLYLGANEILQMAGRVHGRVPNGEVVILSDRDLVFEQLRPDAARVPARGRRRAGGASPAPRWGSTRAISICRCRSTAPPTAARSRCSPAAGWWRRGGSPAYGREVEAMPVERAWGELLVHADAELLPIVAVCSNIDSLHRMTREERDLHGVVVNGSDHLTAYNLYAEAVNQHGYVGEVYGLPRHLFEDGLAEWAERRGVLVKAIEDTALGTASVYRSLELPLPKQLPYASKEIRKAWADLLARFMPFDLVIDEHTADGQEARVSKTSVAGSWGAVAGNLRFFADRFGVPRAVASRAPPCPTTWCGEHARLGPPRVVLTGPRKQQGLAVERRRSLLRVRPRHRGRAAPGRRSRSRCAPLRATSWRTPLMAGETPHPDQGRHQARGRGARRAVAPLGRRARRRPRRRPCGRLVRAQLETGRRAGTTSCTRGSRWTPRRWWTRRPASGSTRCPAMVRVRGDAVPLDYELADGAGRGPRPAARGPGQAAPGGRSAAARPAAPLCRRARPAAAGPGRYRRRAAGRAAARPAGTACTTTTTASTARRPAPRGPPACSLAAGR